VSDWERFITAEGKRFGLFDPVKYLLRPGPEHVGQDIGRSLDLATDARYKTTHMLERFRGENRWDSGLYPNRRDTRSWGRNGVKYLTAEEREAFRIEVRDVGDGPLIYDAWGKIYDTSHINPNLWTGERVMYVMDSAGNFYAAPKVYGVLQHSSFFSGGPVAAAGELVARDGRIALLNRKSGHYVPTEEFLRQAAHRLRERGLSLRRT
jgi:hypothetical protein